MKLSVAAIVKDEADSLLEWIAFHNVVGVQDYFIADNDSIDGTSEMLATLESLGLVHRLPFPTMPEQSPQMPAYMELLALTRKQAGVVAFIDADEYLLPMDGSDTLNPLVDRLFADDTVSAVALNWAIFGSSGALFAETGLVTERFTRRAKQAFGVNHHYKCLVRPERVLNFGNPHFPRLTEGRCIDATGADLVPHPKHGAGLSNRVVWEGARINHYAVKSVEEFLLGKSRRGSAAKKTKIKHKRYFTSHDRNDEECLVARQLALRVRAEYERLEALIATAVEQPADPILPRNNGWRGWAHRILGPGSRSA